MATHASAAKRARQTVKRNLRNRTNISTMKTAVKKVYTAIEQKNLKEIDTLLVEAQSVIARTRRKGAIHMNNMARRISRLTIAVQKAKASVN